MQARILPLMADILQKYHQRMDTELLASCAISYADYCLLSALVQVTDRASQTQLKQEAVVSELGLDKSTVSRRIERLVKKGLINKRENPNSPREKLIKLTAKGLKQIELSEPIVNKLQEEITAKFEPYALKQLSNTLLTILTKVQSS